jgi:hypothetical protein
MEERRGDISLYTTRVHTQKKTTNVRMLPLRFFGFFVGWLTGLFRLFVMYPDEDQQRVG